MANWDKFKLEGLHEGLAVTTCNLETISAFARTQRENKKTFIPMVGRRNFRTLTSGYESGKKSPRTFPWCVLLLY